MGGGYRFFALKSGRAVGDASKWKDHGSSDISYISADDTATYGAFARIFERMGLEEAFAPIVQPLRRLRLYTAKFVVRSRCSCPCFHSDWPTALGGQALTLMTPLADYKTRASFQLLYGQLPKNDDGQHDAHGPDEGHGTKTGDMTVARDEARYEYKRGTAVCFGASFCHSTEPGTAHEDDGCHAYLCFTFGTDDPSHWPLIAATIGNYTRVCLDTDGHLVPTRLGEDLGEDLKKKE